VVMKRRWPVTSKTYWCPECNIPLLSSYCYKCGGEGYELKLREPGDVRLAFRYDLNQILKSLSVEKQHSLLNELSRKIILLNKTTHIDDAKEVIVDGNIFGIMLYNPFERKWEFRPSYYGALHLLEKNAVETCIVKDKIKTNQLLYKKVGLVKEKYVILVNNNGEPKGLGKTMSNGKIRVIKVYKQKFYFETSRNTATIQDVIKGNEERLRHMENEATKFLLKMHSKISKRPIVSFSGGKDSLVSLHLTLQSLGECPLLFNNTGIELPETIETVYETADKYCLNVEEANAGNAFWKSVKFYGPPARDYRWCCKVAKLVPLARKILKKYPTGILNIVGQRAYESLDRAKSPRIWRNKWIPTVISISPIQYWNQLAIWLYIYKYKLKVNPLYYVGFDRIGCFMCPAGRLAEFEVVESSHPELWNRWEAFLYKWAERINAPKEWVNLGLWRWLGPATPKKILAKNAREYVEKWKEHYKAWLDMTVASVSINEKESRIVFSRNIDLNKVRKTCYVLGREIEEKEDTLTVFNGNRNIIYAFTRKGILTVKAKENLLEETLDAVKVIYRSLYCTKCLSCETLCPTSSIRVDIDNGVIINPATCITCRACLDICPIADVLVEKIVISLILGKYDAWRRKSRRKREKVAKFLESLLRVRLATKCPNIS